MSFECSFQLLPLLFVLCVLLGLDETMETLLLPLEAQDMCSIYVAVLVKYYQIVDILHTVASLTLTVSNHFFPKQSVDSVSCVLEQ